MESPDFQGRDSWSADEDNDFTEDESAARNGGIGSDGDIETGVGPDDNVIVPDSEKRLVPREDVDAPWTTYFPFESVRQNQIKGINTFIEGLKGGQYTVMEGACGTGKTLIGLVGALYAISNSPSVSSDEVGRMRGRRHTSSGKSASKTNLESVPLDSNQSTASNGDTSLPPYERAFIVTSVKNQIEQFKEEMDKINTRGNGDSVFNGLVFRGRGDMVPYERDEDALDDDEGPSSIDDLREGARDLVHKSSPVTLDCDVSKYEDARDENSDESPDYEPARMRAVLDLVEQMVDGTGETSDPLVVDDVTSPYPNDIPQIRDVARPQSETANEEGDNPDGEEKEDGGEDRDMSQVMERDGDTNEFVSETTLDAFFDPFYVKYLLYTHPDTHEEVPFGFGSAEQFTRVLDRGELFERGVADGVCPHRLMTGHFLENADVVIGSYMYVFDEASMTGFEETVLDPGTIAVVDEAHNLESKVRDMYEKTRSKQGITQVVNDLEIARAFIKNDHGSIPGSVSNPPSKDIVDEGHDVIDGTEQFRKLRQNRVNEGDNELSDLELAIEFFKYINQQLTELAAANIDTALENHKDTKAIVKSSNEDGLAAVLADTPEKLSPERLERLLSKLEDPEKHERYNGQPVLDDLTEKLFEQFSASIFEDVIEITKNVAAVLTAITEEDTEEDAQLDNMDEDDKERLQALWSYSREPICFSAARGFFRQWGKGSRTRYFRQLLFTPDSDQPDFEDIDEEDINQYDWSDFFTVKLKLYNCFPTEHIQRQLSLTGGGMLMSATLEPLDAYVDATGVGSLIDRDAELSKSEVEQYYRRLHSNEASVETDVPQRGDVERITFDMQFPETNRKSVTVPLQKFTSSNRGSPEPLSGMNNVRLDYANALIQIGAIDGNILICMPSYSEVEWAAELLRRKDAIDKQVFEDESSSAVETEKFIEEFKNGDEHSILVSTVNGTVNEGVDFPGDKLHVAAAIGLGINYVSDEVKASQHAYDEHIDAERGFNLVSTIPPTRKSRQTIGRVIRGDDDVGVRILVDERYDNHQRFSHVREYLSAQEQREFVSVELENIFNECNTIDELRGSED